MKKILVISMVLAAAMAFGAANDSLITFSTKGVDRYADGTKVLDGECYALVWTKRGEAFGGFNANGTLRSENDQLVCVAGLATNGRCPTTIFEIPANEASQYDDGMFALYLLDTRIRNEDGSVGVSMAGRFSKFPPNAVNAVLVVPKDNQAAKVAAGGGSVTGDAVEMSKASIDVHTQIQPPKITAIIPNGANVVLKVEGLEPTADYFVVSGSSPTEFDMTKKAQVKDSQGELKVHKSCVAEFYKIIGVRKFN